MRYLPHRPVVYLVNHYEYRQLEFWVIFYKNSMKNRVEHASTDRKTKISYEIGFIFFFDVFWWKIAKKHTLADEKKNASKPLGLK